MKKLFALLLAAVMCLSLAACGGSTNDNNSTQQSAENSSETETDYTTEGVSDKDEQQSIIAVFDVEYLTGIWVWQKEKSDGSTLLKSFELCADGTGKVLTSTDEELQSATFVWSIENETVVLSSMSAENVGTFAFELHGNDLADLTWTDFFAKEIQ